MTVSMYCGKMQPSEASQESPGKKPGVELASHDAVPLAGKGAYSRDATVREKTVSERILRILSRALVTLDTTVP